MSRAALAKTLGGTGAAAALIALVAAWEGRPGLEPHWDDIGKVWDVCYGDTIAEKRRYTPEECKELLARRLNDKAKAVKRHSPNLRGNQLIAASSLTYNIGEAAYARSTVRRRFNAGDLRGGCDAFLAWRFAKGREIKGLLNRRKAERRLCLEGLD